MPSQPLGYVQMSVTTVVNLSTIPSNPAPSKVAITTETNNIRYRDDGSDPTASVGMLIKTTDPIFVYDGTKIASVRIVSVTGTAVVNVAYYA